MPVLNAGRFVSAILGFQTSPAFQPRFPLKAIIPKLGTFPLQVSTLVIVLRSRITAHIKYMVVVAFSENRLVLNL